MRNIMILFLCFLFAAGHLGAQPLMSFSVKGRIGTCSEPYMAYLSYVSPDGLKTDSVFMKEGSFAFSGMVKSPRKAYLSIARAGSGQRFSRDVIKTFFLETGEVRVDSPDSLANVIVKGGKTNVEYSDLETRLKPVNDSINVASEAFQKLPDETGKSPEARRKFNERVRPFIDQLYSLEMDYMRSHPDSWVSLMTMLDDHYAGRDLALYKSLFDAFPPELKSSSTGVYLTPLFETADKTAIGSPAIDFTIADARGKLHSLKQFRGKYVLVDFWASWCGPCRAENPNVLKAYNAFKSKGFTVVGISIDDAKDKDKWVAAIKKDGMPWTQLSELKGWEAPVAKSYGITAIPQNFLVDREGKIVAKGLRGDDLLAKLGELLGE